MRVGALCVLLITLYSCHKDSYKNYLPIPSCEGKHELGFFVNNETWLPSDKDMYKEYELPKVKLEDGTLRISATRVDEKNHCRNWFCIETKNPRLENGSFLIVNNTCKAAYQTYYYGSNKHLPSETYRLTNDTENLIAFSCIDTLNGIVAGTFNFNAVNSHGRILTFTSGRFDLILEK